LCDDDEWPQDRVLGFAGAISHFQLAGQKIDFT
jgi:hypothetical protein